MGLEGTIAGLRYRRSRRSDAAALTRMMELGDAVGDGLPTPSVFHVFTERDFAALIETALISVTAVCDVPLDAGADDTVSAAAVIQKEVVVGFVSLDDVPLSPASAADAVDSAKRSAHAQTCLQAWRAALSAAEKTGNATLTNSLWLRMLLAPASSVTAVNNASTSSAGRGPVFNTPELTMDLLRVTLGSLSSVEHVFVALHASYPSLATLRGVTEVSTLPLATPAVLCHVARASVLPPLTMRQGRVEDYDDAVTLLVAGGPGIITELPNNFYLEELLQSQDAQHKVLVAEDSVTHEVVGLACVRQISLEDQQYLARFYNTDTLERLKPLNVDGSEAAQARQYQDGRTPSGTASIFFLYFNPRFEHSAHQLLPYVFREFPTCDYATLQRTHAQTLPEPMVLQRFQYMPLRRYQPHNARGEVTAPPDALWVCPRVSLECEIGMQSQVTALSDPANAELRTAVLRHFGTPRAASAAGSGVHAVLHHQQQSRGNSASSGGAGAASAALSNLPGCSAELISALREDLGAEVAGAREKAASVSLPPNRAVFALSWGLPMSAKSSATAAAAASGAATNRTVVGVLSVQPLAVAEMYALRANYDLDRFLSFNTTGGFNYAETDISLSPEEGPLRYRSAELPGLAVRFAYIRPAFRHHLKFFLREVLRQTHAAVLVNLTSVDASLCQTVLSSFTYVPLRRVVEVSSGADANLGITNNSGAGGKDADGSLTNSIPEVNDVTPALIHKDHATTATASSSGGASGAANTNASNKADAKAREKAEKAAAAAANSLALSSLFFTTRRLLCDETVRVHPRLVIVGASATALAMLYELLCVPYVELLNVTLIATDGIPPHPNQALGDTVATRTRQQQLWQADAMVLLEREYMRLRLGDGFSSAASLGISANVVRVVHGTLVDIDTNLKFVQLENNMYEPYDHLILATGRQYITPPAIRALQQQEARSARRGVLALSGVVAEDSLRHALSELNQAGNSSIANVVVYGSGLDAVATLSTMIAIGFPAQRLVLCRPRADGAAAADGSVGGGVFADAASAEAAMALFRVLGVTVLDGYGVSRLEFDDDNLSSVLLASLSYERKAGDAVELPCSMIVCLEDKDIDHNVLTALTKRSIVFDGRVIVGSAYETSQPDVLAAGPVAMFTRRYGATEAFEAYNARDVGRDVAHVLLGRLGLEEFERSSGGDAADGGAAGSRKGTTTAEAGTDAAGAAAATFHNTVATQDTALTTSVHGGPQRSPLPTYASPVCRRVRLPCHYQYFSAVRGDAQFRPEECLRLDYSSTDMLAVSLDDVQTATGGVAEVREMMVVYVHRRHRTVDGVVYLGNGTPTVHNYRAMIGLPESLFHIEFRYQEALKDPSRGKGSNSSGTITNASSAGAASRSAQLTVPPRGAETALDLVAYLRLPIFQPLLCDHFATFFAGLRRDLAEAEEVAAVREKVVRDERAAGALTPEEAAAHVAALTDAKKALRYKVQLALLTYLHEHKDRRAQTMYLPNIEKQVAANKSA